MKRMAMILGLACALAGCGPSDQRAAQEVKEKGQVTVESATREDVPSTGDKEHTQVTVESADEKKPAEQ